MSNDELPVDLAKSARRKWLIRLIIAGVISAVSGAVVSPFLSGTREPNHVNTHQTATGLILSFVFIAVIGGVFVVMLRRMWRGKGIFAIPLATGLPRAQRKTVARAVRQGVPSGDPTLRIAEENLAHNVNRQNRWVKLVCGILAIGFLAFGLFNHDAVARWYYIGTGALIAAFVIMLVRSGNRARRYLVAIGNP